MMKRLLFSLALLALFFSFSKAQTYVQIGNGTESSSMPYTVWSYSWAKALYQAEELDGEKTITHIALDSEGSYDMSNQTVYFKTTADNELSNSYEEPTTENGYTKVYEGNYSVSEGWNEIELNSPIEYNGTDNIVIYWINEDGSEVYANFLATDASGENLIKVKGGDNSVPEEDGTSPYPDALPNIQFFYESDAPANPSNPQPENGRIKVDVDTSLTFDLGENTTHYNLYFGKNKDNLEKVVDMQSVDAPETATHSIDTLLKGDTEYYWQVAAINDASGDETISSVWSFTTEELIENYPWEIGFEDVWEGIGGNIYSSIINTNYPDSTHWEWTEYSWNLEIDSNQVNGNVKAGHFGVHCSASDEGEFFLKTPRFDLPANMRASFWWKNAPREEGKVADEDTAFFQVSNDGGATWNTLDTLAPESTMEVWEQTLVDLSGYSGDNVYMRWVYKVTQTNPGRYVFLDDVKVEAKPTGPVIELSETEITYNELCEGGRIDKEVVISNTGVEDLTVSDVQIDGDFECNYSGTIAPDEKDTTEVSFVPYSTGTHNGYVKFVSNAEFGDSEISLTGEAIAPVHSFFQDFDSSDEFPENWYHIDSPDGYHSGGGVELVSYSWEVFSEPNAAKIYMAEDSINPLLLITPGVTNYVENQLTYYAKSANKAEGLEMQIGVMSNPYDAGSFVPKKTISVDTIYRKDTITFKPTTDKPYIAFKHNGNSNGPDDLTSLRIDNISWEQSEPSKPLPAEVLFPNDDTIGLDIMKSMNLEWSAGSGNTEGFLLCFGTAPGEWDIIDHDTLELDETIHKVEHAMEYSTEYFWKIVPYNEVGDADDCPVWSFSTMEDPIISSFPWSENFDEMKSGLSLPLAWTEQSASDNLTNWSLWTDNPGMAEYAYSSPHAVHISFDNYNSKDDYLYTPPLDLKDYKEYQLSFWWVSPTDPVFNEDFWERMKVFLGDDNTDSTMNKELFNDSTKNSEYEKVSIKFSPNKTGRQFLSFYSWTKAYNNYVLALDNIELVVTNTAPIITSTPDTTAVVDKEYVYDVTADDPDEDDIDITGEEIPDWLDFADNGDGTATLSGKPSSKENYEVKLSTSDGKNHYVQEFTISVEENDESTDISSVTSSDLTIYPNPTEGEIQVTLNNYDQYKNSQIKIIDVTGKIVEKSEVEGTHTTLDLSNLKSGIYLIQVGSLENRVTEKIILK